MTRRGRRTNKLGSRILSIILTLALVFYGVPLDISFRGKSFSLKVEQAEAAGESWHFENVTSYQLPVTSEKRNEVIANEKI